MLDIENINPLWLDRNNWVVSTHGDPSLGMIYDRNGNNILSEVVEYVIRNEQRLASRARYGTDAKPFKAKTAKRRALKRNSTGTHSGADIALLFKTQNGVCWWCGSALDPDNYHVDHRIPLARSGSNAPENLCITCPTCNLSKGDKLPQEWNGRLL